jgi:hypothetical protein
MYTLLELQSKTFGALKKIGYELNVLPEGDRRCRQTWIDAIAGVNPPLLQLLEVSPGVEVEQVQEAIEEVAKTSPGVDVDPAQKPIMETVEDSPAAEAKQAQERIKEHFDISELWKLDEPDCPACGGIHSLNARWSQEYILSFWIISCQKCDSSCTCSIEDLPRCLRDEDDEEDDDVYPRPAQRSIGQAAKNSPGVEVDPVEEPIVPTAKTSVAKVSSSKKVKASSYLDCPSCGIGRLRVKQSIYWETSCTKCGYFAESILYPFTPADTGYKVGDWVKLRIKPRLATNICRGEVVCIDKVQDDYLRFVNPNLNPALVLWARQQFLHPHEVSLCDPPVVKETETFPGVKTEVTVSESAIALAGKTPPGVDLDDELPECSTCFGDGYVEDEFGFIKFCQCETEPKLSHEKTQRVIEPAVKTCLEAESDLNPILTGIRLSDNFLARYSLPHPEYRFQSEADGQLSLLNFEVVTEFEPPDPDDFESLDAFREAIARWDWEHPSSFDHCSDLPNSVHCEPNSVHCEPNSVHCEPNSVNSDPLEVSLDSFCLWTHCPADWYEQAGVIEPSKVMELSPIHKNSSTSDFFIPTFDSLGERSNRSDEPPDTGTFARLPKPKPPTFPPQAISWTQVGHKLDTSWTQVSRQPKSAQVSLSQPKSVHPETLPKLFHRVAAGSSTQPARSPPGGDA